MLGQPIHSRKTIADWLKFEDASGQRFSREQIVIGKGSGLLLSGTVLGLLSVGLALASLEIDNTGNGTITPGAVGAAAQMGTYRINFTSPTAFAVTDPSGDPVGTGAVGTLFNTGGVSFTIAAGSTAFVAGDEGAVTIDPGSGKYVPHDPDASTGAEDAVAILAEDVDASGTVQDVAASAVVRDARIAASGLTWTHVGITDAEIAAGITSLRTARIYAVREA